jgi:hypothetical protein
MLDRQAELPSALERARGEQARDYAALAGLAGLTSERYAGLQAQGQRQARLEIDRELSARRTERGLRHVRETDVGVPRTDRVQRASVPRDQSSEAARPEWQESAVMRDAREVAEGRKKQLGFGRP